MRKKQRKKYVSKYENDAVLISSVVTKIEIQNVEIKDKFKTVFYCESKAKPEGRMCVQWGRSSVKVGDKFEAKGRITEDGTFLVWSLMIFQKPENASA